MRKDVKIAMLYGGISNEREVSLSTGAAMGEALSASGYQNINYLDVDKNFVTNIAKYDIEVCVNALHGYFGEDGRIQAILESLDMPYTGSGVEASCLSFDKIYTKYILKGAGITTSDFAVLGGGIVSRFPPFPCVVKPAREGSTIGVSVVDSYDDLEEAVTFARKFDRKILAESYIKGKEITVGILKGEALPPIWIKPKSGFYDYKSKYTKGETDYLFDLGLPEKEVDRIKKIAMETFSILGCSGYGRVDFIHDGNEAFVLEVNTLPGMTSTSLLPKAALKAGIRFEELVENILNTAEAGKK